MSSRKDNGRCTKNHGSPATTPNRTTNSSRTTSTRQTVATTSSPAPTSARLNTLTAPSKSNAGKIAGSAIGGVVFLVLLTICIVLYLRARKRKRTPPSSEFMNSIRAGAPPVLRLDSGAEYTPAHSEKGAGCTHYPPSTQHPSSVLSMKFPDESTFDTPSGRLSVERPLYPQRYSSQPHASDSFVVQHHPSSSVGSRRELLGSDEMGSGELSPVRRSPVHTDSVLQFVPRFSLDGPLPRSSLPSHSTPPLHPLRRQPDPDDA